MSHTPGPWYAYREGDRNRHFRDQDSYTVMTPKHTEPVAHCGSYLMPAKANANLISAAPDLLSVAKKIVDDPSFEMLDTDICGALEKAIAKAEGR